MLAIALSQLISPIPLFFVLGMIVSLLGARLSISENVGKGLSLYLIMSIGFKGGVELAHTPLDWGVFSVMIAAVLLSLALPVVGFELLRRLTKVSKLDAAAIAAHYGSCSVVTFTAAADFLMSKGIPFEGYMVVAVALMETPAILSGLLLAGRAGKVTPKEMFSQQLGHITKSGGVLVMLGSFLIGAVTSDSGLEIVKNFLIDPFKGVLCLFLLELGTIAGARLKDFRQAGWSLAMFGVYMPLVGALVAFSIGILLNLSIGGMTILATLSASASYIVVPSALRLALPRANLTYAVALALGITFPFNLFIGIPLYYSIACFFHG